MNLEQVATLLKAGFSAAFIERLAGEQPTQAAEQPQDSSTAELKALTGEIKNLISAVQASNIRSMSMGEPQNTAETAASYIESLINGGKKNE